MNSIKLAFLNFLWVKEIFRKLRGGVKAPALQF